MTPVIQLNHISKTFHHRQVLQDINLTINPGHIYGFSGPNGSGKTLTFKIILGFVKATQGTVIVNGQTVRHDTMFADGISFAIQEYGLLANRSGFDNLKLLTLLADVPDAQIKPTLKYVGLDPDDQRRLKDYSLGMTQRLLIASALIKDEAIMIFDEPTNALDEDGQAFLKTMLRALKQQGKTILLSSHDKAFLEATCDHIYYFNEGQLKREAAL